MHDARVKTRGEKREKKKNQPPEADDFYLFIFLYAADATRIVIDTTILHVNNNKHI